MGLKCGGRGDERYDLEIHLGCARLTRPLEIQVEMSNSTVEKLVWSLEERSKLEIGIWKKHLSGV